MGYAALTHPACHPKVDLKKKPQSNPMCLVRSVYDKLNTLKESIMNASIRNITSSIALSFGLLACAQPSPPPVQPPVPMPPPVEMGDQPLASDWQCGDQRVRLMLAMDAPVGMLQLNGRNIDVRLTRTASGARYASADGAADLWTKGDEAMFNEQGKQSLCKLIPQPSPLTGGEWRVEDLAHKGIIDNSHITLNFNADGRINGSTSCNRYMGSYTSSNQDETLSISQVATTRMACAPALMAQEALFTGLLASIKTYAFDDRGALVLTTTDGRQMIALRP